MKRKRIASDMMKKISRLLEEVDDNETNLETEEDENSSNTDVTFEDTGETETIDPSDDAEANTDTTVEESEDFDGDDEEEEKLTEEDEDAEEANVESSITESINKIIANRMKKTSGKTKRSKRTIKEEESDDIQDDNLDDKEKLAEEDDEMSANSDSVTEESDETDDMEEWMKTEEDESDDIQDDNLDDKEKLAEEDDDEDLEEEEDEEFSNAITSAEVTEAVDTMLEGEKLSRKFRAKAKAIFESAVNNKIKKVQRAYKSRLLKKNIAVIESVVMDIVNHLDRYTNFIVEEWMTDNKIAIDSGLRTAIMEEFMSSLKSVFESHYIDVPENKVNVIQEQARKIKELEQKENQYTEKIIQLKEVVSEFQRDEILNEMCGGLPSLQADKLRSLSEGLTCSNANQFRGKVKLLKESYFKNKPRSSKRDIDSVRTQEDENVSLVDDGSSMSHYLQALKVVK